MISATAQLLRGAVSRVVGGTSLGVELRDPIIEHLYLVIGRDHTARCAQGPVSDLGRGMNVIKDRHETFAEDQRLLPRQRTTLLAQAVEAAGALHLHRATERTGRRTAVDWLELQSRDVRGGGGRDYPRECRPGVGAAGGRIKDRELDIASGMVIPGQESSCCSTATKQGLERVAAREAVAQTR